MRGAKSTRAGLRRAALVGSLALATSLGASACTTFDDVDWDIGDELGGTTPTVPDEVVVDATASSAELVVGQTLVVDLGEMNSSVGDDWLITDEPDGEVLREGERFSEYLGEDGEDGGRNTLAYEFEAVGDGETTLELEYRFRGGAPDFGHGPEPVSITVTVTDP
ncbi:protease inhibitor I42 family protein [Sanguibacter sp. 25GB23B1]|uniref:protease inhibitor I42 family protein n=1 Tax=unclassified Sanguibacter TaxID=2645534 RepID=UPI0032AF3F7A